MTAPKGNEFWKVRSKSGRNPIFKTPDALWKSASEWFEWVEANPLQEEKVFAYQGEIVKTTVNKMRAMTLQGLCIFLDISTQALRDYKSREDFIGVINKIEEIIYNQKFVGASADQLNANIIARDLGLAEKKEVREVTNDLEELEKLTLFLKENGIDIDAIK